MWEHFTDYLTGSEPISHDALAELWAATRERLQGVGADIEPTEPAGTYGKAVSSRCRQPNGFLDPDGVRSLPYWLNKYASGKYMLSAPAKPVLNFPTFGTNELTLNACTDLGIARVTQSGHVPAFLAEQIPSRDFFNAWRRMIQLCDYILVFLDPRDHISGRTYDELSDRVYSPVWATARDAALNAGWWDGSGSRNVDFVAEFTGTNFGAEYMAYSVRQTFPFTIPENALFEGRGYQIGRVWTVRFTGEAYISSSIDVYVNDTLLDSAIPPANPDANTVEGSQWIWDFPITTETGIVNFRTQFRAASDPAVADLYQPPSTPELVRRLCGWNAGVGTTTGNWWLKPNFSHPAEPLP